MLKKGEYRMRYQKLYALMVEAVAKALDEISKTHIVSQETENAVEILKRGLEEAEEMYLAAGE